jgi:hypothetical protein
MMTVLVPMAQSIFTDPSSSRLFVIAAPPMAQQMSSVVGSIPPVQQQPHQQPNRSKQLALQLADSAKQYVMVHGAGGSLSSLRVQTAMSKAFAALYEEVVVRYYKRSWHKFCQDHGLQTFHYSAADIEADNLEPYIKQHEARLRLPELDATYRAMDKQMAAQYTAQERLVQAEAWKLLQQKVGVHDLLRILLERVPYFLHVGNCGLKRALKKCGIDVVPTGSGCPSTAA